MYENIRNSFVILGLLIILSGCTEEPVPNKISIIPRPVKMVESGQIMRLSSSTKIIYSDSSLSFSAYFLRDQLTAITNLTFEVIEDFSNRPGAIYLSLGAKNTDPESYILSIADQKAILSASAPQGVFYGIQSLLQTLQSVNEVHFFAGVEIEDGPRFSWRGMHLDVSRHFFGVEKIKRYIDYLAMYKLNIFHWHLTDDQGWRIEIKQYPLLTEQGAWRKSVGFASNQAKGLNKDDGKPYGGFYTQEEVKEIVRYAQDRAVTIVPEIEMPGHTSAVLKAYPTLACDGIGRAEIWGEGGISKNVFCAGKEETFEFLENVLNEVLQLFPPNYIHIGGDEAPKDHWEKCGLCQKRIRTEQLADEHELQSYFITRMEKFLNAKDRKLIGWDEILEGGLAPNATVMSWRGIAGGIAAAKSHHDAVMTPGYPLYFNHRPIDLKNSPGHKSSNNTITTVYNYEPVPAELSAEESQYVIGVQANLWTEYIPEWEHVESLLFPRLLSLAEIAWTPAERKDFEDFRNRIPYQLSNLDRMGVNYGKDPYQVAISMQMENRKQMVSMATELPGMKIRYTEDGSTPNSSSQEYQTPFPCVKTMVVKAAAFDGDTRLSEVSEMNYLSHLATGKNLEYQNVYNPKYNGGGDFGLIDGRFGSEESISFGWQGFDATDFQVSIDLGEEINVKTISAGFLIDQSQWIFQPDEVTFEISSNGKDFETIFQKVYDEARDQQVVQMIARPRAEELNVKARYVRVKAFHGTPIPSWHSGAGTRPWLFVDEIVIE
ncbi:MAG: family 20 glycosylhydrolase [Reichenbachiella sp.]|uniref:glycoside hydrolase family 20 protein n=1 Tax=Reichenbachiella sp. TaxID=2184521 RepID=UPI0032639C19